MCFALSQELKKQINEQNKKAGTVLCLLVPCLGKVFIHMHSRGSPFYHPPAQPSTSFLTLFDARVGSFRSSKLDSLSTSQGLTERERESARASSAICNAEAREQELLFVASVLL